VLRPKLVVRDDAAKLPAHVADALQHGVAALAVAHDDGVHARLQCRQAIR
jgi:hypothetical protein